MAVVITNQVMSDPAGGAMFVADPKKAVCNSSCRICGVQTFEHDQECMQQNNLRGSMPAQMLHKSPVGRSVESRQVC